MGFYSFFRNFLNFSLFRIFGNSFIFPCLTSLELCLYYTSVKCMIVCFAVQLSKCCIAIFFVAICPTRLDYNTMGFLLCQCLFSFFYNLFCSNFFPPNSPPKGPTTSSAGGMRKPPWGKTSAFPPKGGLTNRSFFTGWPLKSGSLLMLHPISFVLLLNILLYRLFVYITDRLTIISSCPEMTISSLSILWMSVKNHKRTLAFN